MAPHCLVDIYYNWSLDILKTQPDADPSDKFLDRSRLSRPGAQSMLTKVTWKVTSKLTARVIVELVSLPVIPAVTPTVRSHRRSCEFASRFRPAPAAAAAVMDTSPRPLIPPSQRRERDQRGGMAKRLKSGRGGAPSRNRISMTGKHQDSCDETDNNRYFPNQT